MGAAMWRSVRLWPIQCFIGTGVQVGHSGWKGRLLGWWVSDLNFFGINQWVGTSLAARRQILTFVAHFGRFRAKKWPNSTFLRTDFESFGFSYFFCIFDPTQGQYGWKHYALRAGWLDLAQKCAKLPNLAKTLKSQNGQLPNLRSFFPRFFWLKVTGGCARSI